MKLPYDATDPLLCAASWSRVVEPADAAAARLVAAMGSTAALTWLLEEALTAQGQVRADVPVPVGRDDEAARRAWRQAVERWAVRVRTLDVRRELEFLTRLGGQVVYPGHRWWPAGLDDLERPPMCLWTRGDASLLSAGEHAGFPGVAVVGARAATRYGERVAADMARELTAAGVLVTSGGAYGIDAAAHRGALAAGPTVSVCAGGVDRLYPAGNAGLLQEVIAHGVLVAEVPPGSQPGRHRFLSRNRLIAALSQATVVVEAAWRSGALSTARHARDLGRHLGAVPGPVTSMESAGCHRLLREGAVCVTDAADVLELVRPLGSVDPDAGKDAALDRGNLLDGLDPLSSQVLDAMPARGRASAQVIARASGLSEAEVRSALGWLEVAGRAVRDGGGWRRAASR